MYRLTPIFLNVKYMNSAARYELDVKFDLLYIEVTTGVEYYILVWG